MFSAIPFEVLIHGKFLSVEKVLIHLKFLSVEKVIV